MLCRRCRLFWGWEDTALLPPMEPPVDGEGPKLLCWCADVMVDDDELDKADDESESLLFSVPCRGCKRGDEDDDAWSWC